MINHFHEIYFLIRKQEHFFLDLMTPESKEVKKVFLELLFKTKSSVFNQTILNFEKEINSLFC